MNRKSLVKRLERLEDHLLPVNEEPIVIRIFSVSPDGERVDTGMEFKIAAVPKLIEKRRR
jgi:hypothetical protein